MKDFDFMDIVKIEYVRKKFIETSEIFGFKLMEPSPIEFLSTIELKSNPLIKNEIYYFKDKSSREIALRFDFTVGLTRYVASQKSVKLPIKVATFGGVWRYDEPQKNRYRFFHQWNVELYGKLNIEYDIELIEFVACFFCNLNLQNIVIHISHKKLAESYINNIFNSSNQKLVVDICRAIDKTQKKSKNEIITEYNKKGYDLYKLKKILEFAEINGTPEEIEKNLFITRLDGWSDLKKLFYSLKKRNIKNIKINFGIVRGLDYYSGIVFEAFDSYHRDALIGGGRYDVLLQAFKRNDLTAVGAAGGVERIISSLEIQNKLDLQFHQRILITFVNKDMQKNALHLASTLKQKKIPADVAILKTFKKQMKDATSYKFIIIIAPKELELGLVIFKNMTTSNEKKVSIDGLTSHLKDLLANK